MKHFANFNNIGLGVGAAVGLARGSGLIGESQEERDSTTWLGRLGKLAGYGGSGAALGVGAGMAVKYVRGNSNNSAETPPRRPQPPEPAIVAPLQSEGRRKAAEVQARIDNLKQEGQEAINSANSWANPRPEPATPPPLSRPTGYRGLSPDARAEKLADRRDTWEHLSDNNFDLKALGKAYNDPTLSKKARNNIYGTLEKETTYKNLVSLQDDIKSGRYSKPTTTTKNF
jgi:hypothetical protein